MKNLEKRYKKKFLKIFTTTFSIFFIGLLFIFFGYKFLSAEQVYDPSKQRDSTLITEKELKQQVEQTSTGIFKAPIRTNILITGVDEQESLTDVIMVASYISTTGEINLLSIPRDTYMSYKGEDLNSLREINRGAPSYMKMNSVYAYTKDSGIDFLQSSIENMLGIKIDYYVKVDLDAFVSIVDAVGGIYFNVPEGGLKYSDPMQDLYINLKEGEQLLDGKQAEGLVRFRKGYATQDLKRVEIQQEFIKEFIRQVLSKETLMSNLGDIIINLIKYVETDFDVADVPKYITSIANIDTNKMNTATLPGTPQTIDGLSYYVMDTNSTNEIIDRFFYGNTDPQKEENIETSQTETIIE